MYEIFNTACYTLSDALIWWGLGFALAASLFAPDYFKSKNKCKMAKKYLNDKYGCVYYDTDSIKVVKMEEECDQ